MAEQGTTTRGHEGAEGPLVSVVVPTYERPEALARCLDSIESTVHVPHEVVCVTVAGDEATEQALAGRSVRQIVQGGRGGFVEALNMGLRGALGTYVTQLNDDCVLL
ncbi:MAG: glycosyltransferase, partial [Planctomycetes bacterium]|nr:glycosyltransferase [Planctomycetota bacterium]